MVHLAPTFAALSFVHAPRDTSAATVHWTISVTALTTATTMETVTSVCQRMTLPSIHVIAIQDGLVVSVNILWSVITCFLILIVFVFSFS